MKTNQVMEKLRNGGAVFGCMMQQYRSAEIPRLFAAAGFDFLFIDTEHGSFDLETVEDLIQSANETGITPLVRVGELLYSLVARALDSGAQGVIFPRIEDTQPLREAISWTRFPPEGKRGYGVRGSLVDYEPRSFHEIIKHLNTSTLVVVQLETRTAIERCEELLAVPGIDVALVGPSDLSVSLGVPGEFEHPTVEDAMVRILEACKRTGVVAGIQSRTVALAQRWIARGMRFVGCGSEHSLLLEKAKETVGSLRAAAPKQT